MHGYSLGHKFYRVDLKGRAWVSVDKFQILRIEADMVNPMRKIQLLSEHQTVEYGPVPFAKKNTSLWLPKSAEIYFDFRKHRYYRHHIFDHYVLFDVDVQEKANAPLILLLRDEAALRHRAGPLLPGDSTRGVRISKIPRHRVFASDVRIQFEFGHKR